MKSEPAYITLYSDVTTRKNDDLTPEEMSVGIDEQYCGVRYAVTSLTQCYISFKTVL